MIDHEMKIWIVIITYIILIAIITTIVALTVGNEEGEASHVLIFGALLLLPIASFLSDEYLK